MDDEGSNPQPTAGSIIGSSTGDGASPEEAFDRFVREESPRLVAAATVILGDRHRAEELAQDTLVKAYGRWRRLQRMDRPGAWTRRVVINAAISEQRRRGSERRAFRKAAGRPAPALSAPSLSDPGLSDPALSSPLPDADLWAAVRRIPNQQAQALALRYGADLSAADVGEALGLSPSATNALLYRARQRLRDDLAGHATTRTPGDQSDNSPAAVHSNDGHSSHPAAPSDERGTS